MLRNAQPGPPAFPRHARSTDRIAIRRGDLTSEPILDVLPQSQVGGQLRRLRAAGGAVGMPLRGGGTVLKASAARRRVAPQLSREGGRRPFEPARDLAHAMTLSSQERDLLALGKGQIAPRRRLCRWREMRWWHAAGLPEPPGPHGWRYLRLRRRVLARVPRCDRRPEQAAIAAGHYRRPGRHRSRSRRCPLPAAAWRSSSGT